MALSEVGAVSSTLDLNRVLKTIVDRAVELSGTDAGSILLADSSLARHRGQRVSRNIARVR
jgi:hypothetical protein